MGEAVEHFSYDKVGNRTTDAKTGANQWDYNQNNELQSFDNTSFKYNLNGQMTEKTVNGQKTSYSYNLDNRLSEIKDNANQIIAQYQYDPFGRRTKKYLPQTNETIYFHYSDEGLIAEYNASGSLIQSYGYKPNSNFTSDPIFTHRPDFSEEKGYAFYINDHLGTPQKLILRNGRSVWEASTDSFGKTIITKDEFRNYLRFPGQYKDDESQMEYNFWRYYDSQVGRYITSDPIGLFGGVNSYNYVLSSPLNYKDFTGLECVTVYSFTIPDFTKEKVSEKVIDKGKWKVSHHSAHMQISTDIFGVKKTTGRDPTNLISTGMARCQLLKIIKVKIRYRRMGTEYTGGYCYDDCDLWFWDNEERVVVDEWDENENRKEQIDRLTSIPSATRILAKMACYNMLKDLK